MQTISPTAKSKLHSGYNHFESKKQRGPRIRSKAVANLFAYALGSRMISGPSSLLRKPKQILICFRRSCALPHKQRGPRIRSKAAHARAVAQSINKNVPQGDTLPRDSFLLCFSLVAYRDYSSSANSSVSSKKPSSSKPSSEFSNSSAKSWYSSS